MSKSGSTVAASLSRVPPFPPVAAKLLRLLADPVVNIAEVAELISSDATFTARLLQRVNSVEFGLQNSVASVRQAVTLLGIDLTRKIVVSHATAAYAQGALGIEELRRCWQHTVATAVLAEEIAKACNAFTQTAFTAGIVHDIGRLGLLVTYPRDYVRVIRNAAERCLDVLDFEHEEFGMDHAQAGRMLAERWQLPPEMAAIAGRHHDPCEGAELDLLRVVHVACRMADAVGYDVVKPLGELDLDTVLQELPAHAQAPLRRDPAEYRALIEERISEYGAPQREIPQPESSEQAVPILAKETSPTPCQAEPREHVRERHWFVAGLIAAAIAFAMFVWSRLR
jgi:putative nucleotidyltransferase with HDIG domain